MDDPVARPTAPITAETPMSLTPELKKIGAKNPGLDTPLSGEDLSFAVQSALKPLKGGSFWARIMEGLKGAKIWQARKQKLRGQKHEFGELDIGE